MFTQTVERRELHQVIDMLPDDRVIAALDFLKGLRRQHQTPPAPESVTAHGKEELYKMLEVGRTQIRAGKVIDADYVMARLKDEHGFSG